jgi:hypothetical protein
MNAIRCGGTAALAAALALALGCGGGGADEGTTATVSGAVSYDGRPVENGSIKFVSTEANGGTGSGAIKDGRYTATKVPVGKTQVSISGFKVLGTRKLIDGQGGPEVPNVQEIIPAKYNSKSELTFEASRGENSKDWELSK